MFWFFKQIYYNFRRFFKFKTLFLFALMFLFIMLKNKVFAVTTISEIEYNNNIYFLDYPLTLTNNNDYYYILTNNDVSTFYIVEPSGINDLLSTWNNWSDGNNNFITINGYTTRWCFR